MAGAGSEGGNHRAPGLGCSPALRAPENRSSSGFPEEGQSPLGSANVTGMPRVALLGCLCRARPWIRDPCGSLPAQGIL